MIRKLVNAGFDVQEPSTHAIVITSQEHVKVWVLFKYSSSNPARYNYGTVKLPSLAVQFVG